MKIVFCTYCSKSKHDDPGEVPAIRRYNSKRIECVYQAACELKLPFYILSGRFGLTPPHQHIPNYDFLLKEQTRALTELVVKQIHECGIDGFVYFTKSPSTDPKLQPYHDTLTVACRAASRLFVAIELQEEL